MSIKKRTETRKATQGVLPYIVATHELPQGYSFLLKGDPMPVWRMVRLCAVEELFGRSVRLEMGERSGTDAVWVRFTGSEEVKEFLKHAIVARHERSRGPALRGTPVDLTRERPGGAWTPLSRVPSRSLLPPVPESAGHCVDRSDTTRPTRRER